MGRSVKLSQLAKELDLQIINPSSDFEEIEISNGDVNRPGLQLTGFMEAFPYKRIQIIGNVEYYYYMQMTPELRYERFRGLLSEDIPCLIFSYAREVTQDIIDLANYYDKTIMLSEYATTKLISKLSVAIERHLAEQTTIHGGLLDVYGSGMLILGESSVGKSETALDLITKGHRLVADDVVEISKIDEKLYGQSPENIRHFMEIRGIGILDIRRLYGTGSVKTDSQIDMVIELENWNEDKEYDRLGLEEEFEEILGIKIPKLTVPVKPGRNIAMIIEVAVRNLRQKNFGYNSAKYLTTKIYNDMNPNNEIDKDYVDFYEDKI
ncbi:HPr(Ser) kinase/phosphatase [Helcococcus kunzii]|uniref:HPr kinase/phosphorylase n=1 Tax=Helcococcus kunzii ATCC 51366 TaxID=883114 RepID=H3NP95_9FIRM|nr:HPr(Ser) kinase/phosphatase [Helcococcus kunzii]EHR33557.1 HPr(Ser) kinase/phosphatase [Helcococcus kunzii ATCC 51366]QZO75767.1 HPr(Ser) kinase/phosphatase [Helcococcus kunzii]